MGGLGHDILAFDTSAAHCAAAVLKDDAICAEYFDIMERGQAERLMPILEEALAEAKVSWRDLDAIGVGVGPGSFTGVRIAVSAARGLALALGIPAIGVSNFEIMRDPLGLGANPAEIVSLPAPRDQAYVQQFRYGVPQSPPRVINPSDPPADLELPANMTVRGYRAMDIARPFHASVEESAIEGNGRRIARVAEWKLKPGDTPERPVPLYVRPADAAVPREKPPQILA